MLFARNYRRDPNVVLTKVNFSDTSILARDAGPVTLGTSAQKSRSIQERIDGPTAINS
jgi:hypothetical protein